MRAFIMFFAMVLIFNPNVVLAKQVITKAYIEHIIDTMNAASRQDNRMTYIHVLDEILDENVQIYIETDASGLGSISFPYQQVMQKDQFLTSSREVLGEVKDYTYQATLTGVNIGADKQSATFSVTSHETGRIDKKAAGKLVKMNFKGMKSCVNKAIIKDRQFKITDINCKGTTNVMPADLANMSAGLE